MKIRFAIWVMAAALGGTARASDLTAWLLTDAHALAPDAMEVMPVAVFAIKESCEKSIARTYATQVKTDRDLGRPEMISDIRITCRSLSVTLGDMGDPNAPAHLFLEIMGRTPQIDPTPQPMGIPIALFANESDCKADASQTDAYAVKQFGDLKGLLRIICVSEDVYN